jgi:thiol-disulfide isomerase/thioredoxin
MNIYFFHAAHCGPCRAIKPLVDRLSGEYPNLVQVDVAEQSELVREFGIAATPSFIAVDGARILGVKLGAVSESWLRTRLAD